MSYQKILNKSNVEKERSKRKLKHFAEYVNPKYRMQWFHEYIMDTLQAFFESKDNKLIISLPPQHGKLISDDTPVITPNGFVNHGDLKAGDYVYGLDGKPKEVLALSEKGYADMVIEFTNGERIHCHNRHEWLVESKAGERQVLETYAMVGTLKKGNSYYLPNRNIAIKSITEAKPKIGNCIQVEGGIYLVGKTMLPTHNSEIVSRLLPAWLLGKNPEYKIALASYNFQLAKSFNTDIKRIIDTSEYRNTFATRIIGKKDTELGQNTAYQFDVSGGGYFIATGVGGSLTGKTVDIGIIDDPYKSIMEAKSSTIRGKVWDWYTSVFSTRGHNEMKQIIMMTRWDENDLAGRLLSGGDCREIKFPAIKDGHIENDPRDDGEALWSERHGLERLNELKKRDPVVFDAMFQQDPKPNTSVLVYPDWKETDLLPDWNIMLGLDYGWTNDPTAFTEIRYNTDTKEAVVRSLLYDTAKDLEKTKGKDFLQIIADVYHENYPDEKPLVIADKDYVAKRQLTSKGVRIIEATKGAGSILSGIQTIRGWDIKIYNSPKIVAERNNYQYVVIDGEVTNTPIDKHNHATDSIRYGFERITRKARIL